MIRPKLPHTSRFHIGLALVLGLVLLSSAPFVHALEIHHVFAEVDHDGHQHSDFDLCKWNQHHTANSLALDAPRVAHCFVVTGCLFLDREEGYVSLTRPLCHPRGPPVSLFS